MGVWERGLLEGVGAKRIPNEGLSGSVGGKKGGVKGECMTIEEVIIGDVWK